MEDREMIYSEIMEKVRTAQNICIDIMADDGTTPDMKRRARRIAASLTAIHTEAYKLNDGHR